eukprot:Protomagalhaensia_wolfi_Nauph_80__977@NODE_1564_length_1468_cov_15_437369_g526_i1_p1_GENE_NODE_1564_length_1468_cov_15_437369_g526_i1NODE_1564_length_1468_cov_15_437369_g526_i1_p1_ORF_typecomplete_len199_score18_91_NODE_1564_length_1468_cov_15_437369_g526_i16161212
MCFGSWRSLLQLCRYLVNKGIPGHILELPQVVRRRFPGRLLLGCIQMIAKRPPVTGHVVKSTTPLVKERRLEPPPTNNVVKLDSPPVPPEEGEVEEEIPKEESSEVIDTEEDCSLSAQQMKEEHRLPSSQPSSQPSSSASPLSSEDLPLLRETGNSDSESTEAESDEEWLRRRKTLLCVCGVDLFTHTIYKRQISRCV